MTREIISHWQMYLDQEATSLCGSIRGPDGRGRVRGGWLWAVNWSHQDSNDCSDKDSRDGGPTSESSKDFPPAASPPAHCAPQCLAAWGAHNETGTEKPHGNMPWHIRMQGNSSSGPWTLAPSRLERSSGNRGGVIYSLWHQEPKYGRCWPALLRLTLPWWPKSSMAQLPGAHSAGSL